MEQEALYTPVQELEFPSDEEVVVYAHPEYRDRHAGEFTRNQKKWLRQAFGNECSHPDQDHECQGDLQGHHIEGKAYALDYLKKDASEVNRARNFILVCQNVHQGIEDVEPDPSLLHPDHYQATEDFRNGDRQAFKELSVKHRGLIAQGIKNWFTDWDNPMASYSLFKVRQFDKKYQHPYPGKL